MRYDGTTEASERLAEHLGEARQQLERVRSYDEVVMVSAVADGGLPCHGELVEAALLEADRVRAHATARLRGEGTQGARVDAARKKHADGWGCRRSRRRGGARSGRQCEEGLAAEVPAIS
jgi:hypothetical protein